MTYADVASVSADVGAGGVGGAAAAGLCLALVDVDSRLRQELHGHKALN